MTRSKVFAPIILLLLMVGCASSGNIKPTVLVDQYNNVPADIQSQFVDRYKLFITSKERKEFNKLLTDEDQKVFIDNFWTKRDPDPATPENEFKQKIDGRIEDVINEIFFGTFGTDGLMFRSNGGFNGDMAHVYLLHGEPDAMDVIEGHSFVPMMLWVYINPETGRLLYAFLFYQKGGLGEFKLFYQDSYKMEQCGAIYEVATMRNYNYAGGGGQNCPEDLYEVYDEIARSSGKNGVLDGNIFAWALLNFSNNSDLRLDNVLDPPKPASEIARESKARVVGEAPKLVGTPGTDYVLDSCDGCNSFIPVELSFRDRLSISAPWKNFDWRVRGENMELSIKYRVILYSRSGNEPIILEDTIVMTAGKGFLEESPDALIIVDLLEPDHVAVIPAGTYSVSVYIKNTLTGKYNAWDSVEFTK